MSISDWFRSNDSLSTELSQHEADISWQDGRIPEDADTLEWEQAEKARIDESMSRSEMIDRLNETRKRVWW